MELYAMTPGYSVIKPIDLFTELIWTDRYNKCGDFELYMPVEACLDTSLAKGNVIRLRESDRCMIIEDTKTQTAKGSGKDAVYKVVGRDLSSILDRRIIWKQIDFTGTVHNLIKRILNENVISPTNTARTIPNFTFSDSTGGRMGETITIQLHGENVLSTIEAICAAYELGFKVTPNNQNGGFIFKLYAGVDRSYEQDTNPWVVFSPEYENLSDTTLLEKTSTYKNTACVYNEYITYDYEGGTSTQNVNKSEVEVYNNFGQVSGLSRREIFVNSYKSHTKEDGTEYTQNEYNAILTAEGKEDLGEYEMASAFSGSIEALRQFILNRDFNLGDIISIENEYGQKGRCRVIEIIYNQNPTGESILPSFENVDETTITDI